MIMRCLQLLHNKFFNIKQIINQISYNIQMSLQKSQFHIYRDKYQLKLPQILQTQSLQPHLQPQTYKPLLIPLFPSLIQKGIQSVTFKHNDSNSNIHPPINVGCVLSGGQAPGGHNVIVGIFQKLKKINPESKLYGFLDGPHGIYSHNYILLTQDIVNYFRNRGGFDMIRSGRHKIQKPEEFQNSLKICNQLDLNGLVIIGGDDSNTNAALLAQYLQKHQSKTIVIGCPKTIDGDLKNQFVEVSFGFDTACKTYSESIGNIMLDTISTKKYYHFIRLMGRSASHIALQCALITKPTYVLIGQEIQHNKQSLREIVNKLVKVIVERGASNMNYGIILIPEGLIEFIVEIKELIKELNKILAKQQSTLEPQQLYQKVLKQLGTTSAELFKFLPKAISNQLLLDRDPHGNVQVAKIETQKLLISLIKAELEKKTQYSQNFHYISHYLGYQGRCAFPTNFDCNYCYSLGYNAAALIQYSPVSGLMSCIKNLKDQPYNWQPAGYPLVTMIDLQRRKDKDVPVITKAYVQLQGPMFKLYEKNRELWAKTDCFIAVGPIQFEYMDSQVPFLVECPESLLNPKPLNLKSLPFHPMSSQSLSPICQLLSNRQLQLPTKYKFGYKLSFNQAIPYASIQLKKKCNQLYPQLQTQGQYFLEIRQGAQANYKKLEGVIGVSINGRQSPGIHNVIKGLLDNCSKLYGFISGVEGILNGKYITIHQGDIKNYINQGGVHFLGRSKDKLHTKEELQRTKLICNQLNLDGLVLIGATHTLTDAMMISQYFLTHKVKTNIVAVPASTDASVVHPYLELPLGFSSTSHMMSSLLGNLMTDASSNTKYWYFIRLMSKQMGHLVMECALQTMPNIVLLGEEIKSKKWSLKDVIEYIADIIVLRSKDKKNYGCLIMGEMFISWITEFVRLFKQLDIITKQKGQCNQQDVSKYLSSYIREYYLSLPDFIRTQILNERETNGQPKYNEIETERMLAVLVQMQLKKRKKENRFSGSFSSVCHYFGYQTRSSHPNMLDSHLGYVYGYLASVLVNNNLTGYCTTVRGTINKPDKWFGGAIPLIKMSIIKTSCKSVLLDSYGEKMPIIAPGQLNMSSIGYQKYVIQKEKWKFTQHYQNPGPIQFFGEKQYSVPMIISLSTQRFDSLWHQIKKEMQELECICGFGSDQDLLQISKSSLSNLIRTIKIIKTKLYEK